MAQKPGLHNNPVDGKPVATVPGTRCCMVRQLSPTHLPGGQGRQREGGRILKALSLWDAGQRCLWQHDARGVGAHTAVGQTKHSVACGRQGRRERGGQRGQGASAVHSCCKRCLLACQLAASASDILIQPLACKNTASTPARPAPVAAMPWHGPGLKALLASASSTTPATSPPGTAGSRGSASQPRPSRSCSMERGWWCERQGRPVDLR